MSSETEHTLVCYKLGTPEGWEEAVNALPWEEVRPSVFRKAGQCPRCNADLNFEVPMVFPVAPIDAVESTTTADTVKYECACEFEHPKSKGQSGCGSCGEIAEPEVL